MQKLFENWRRYLTEDQLLKEERIKKYIVESGIEHLGENNNFEQLDEEVADWLQDAGHLVLDVLGVALDPLGGLGAVPDAINGVWYLTRGCYLYAALSFLSIVPVDKTFDELERSEKTPEKVKAGVPKMRGAVDTFRTDKESPESCEAGDPPGDSGEEKQTENKLQINVEPT